MDPIAVVTTTLQVLNKLLEYVQAVRDAPKEITALSAETSSLSESLSTLERTLMASNIVSCIEQDPELKQDVTNLESTLELCKKSISELSTHLEKGGMTTSGSMSKSKRLFHPLYQKEKVENAMAIVRRTREQLKSVQSNTVYLEVLKIRALLATSLSGGGQAMTLATSVAPTTQADLSLLQLDNQGASLCKAARDDNFKLIEWLLDNNIPVDLKDEDGRTALSLAAETGSVGIVRWLLERGATANSAAHESKWTPLHWAAHRGDVEIATLLKNAGAILDAKSNEQHTPVQIAASGGHIEMVRYLLACGADVNTVTDKGWTMLHTAASQGLPQLAALLLEQQGVDVDKASSGDCNGHRKGSTPLHCAARKGQDVIVDALLKHGADPKMTDSKGQKGRTALMDAAQRGHTAIVRHLYEAGAELDQDSSAGWTALHFAAAADKLTTVKYLVDVGANQAIKIRKANSKEHEGCTAGEVATGKSRIYFKSLGEVTPVP